MSMVRERAEVVRRSIEKSANVSTSFAGRTNSMSYRQLVPPDPVIIAASSGAAWESEILAQLVELARLPRNWDSYGARPLAVPSVRALMDLTRQLAESIHCAPKLAMAVDGGLVCDWFGADSALTLLIDGDGNVTVEHADSVSGAEWEGPIQETVDLDKKIWHASL